MILAAGNASASDMAPRITSYAKLLAEDFPPEAFTHASLAAVAKQSPFWPSFGELCSRLREWWEEHKPVSSRLLIADESRVGWSREDHAWYAYFRQREAEDFGPNDKLPPNFRSSKRLVESLVRQQSAKAWQRICDERAGGQA